MARRLRRSLAHALPPRSTPLQERFLRDRVPAQARARAENVWRESRVDLPTTY